MSHNLVHPLLVVVSLALAACSGGSGGSEKARVRVLNTSPDYTSVDLLLDDETRVASVAYESITDYEALASDKYEVKFKRSGVSSTLSTFDDTLGKGSRTTYVAYGATGGFGVITIDENREEADKDETDVQVVNTAIDAGTLDVYFTEESVALDDATAEIAGIGAGTASGYKTLDSGTYRLRVTLNGSKTDVRLDVSEVTLPSKGVMTIVLSNTPGGTLTNAILLPQEESMTFLRNTDARVRVAAGVAAGSTVTAKMGNASLTSSAPSSTLSSYRLIGSGTVTPDVTVDGVAAITSATNLVAGGDYTLLVWNEGGQSHASFLTDNNRLSRSGFVKVRLINAMSGPAEPLTLAVDFYPVAEGVALAQSAENAEVDPISDGQIDVTRTNTGATIHTRTSVELEARSVYSMVMFGDQPSALGVLRKDR